MFADIAGTRIEMTSDEDGLHWVSMPPPICPRCGTGLTIDGDEEDSRVSVTFRWHNDATVECPECPYRATVQGL